MKVKIIKKVLATITAAATVMMAPGFAGACPKHNGNGDDNKDAKKFIGKKMGRKKDGEEKDKKFGEAKRLKIKENDENGEKNYIEVFQDKTVDYKRPVDKIEFENNKSGEKSYEKFFVFPYMGKDDEKYGDESDSGTMHYYTAAMDSIFIAAWTSSSCSYDPLGATNRVKHLKEEGSLKDLKDCSNEQKLKLINMLFDWSKSANPGVRKNVAAAIGDLVEKGVFNGGCDEQKEKITKALAECAASDEAKANVIWALGRLDENGFLSKDLPPQLLQLKSTSTQLVSGDYVPSYVELDDDSSDIGI